MSKLSKLKFVIVFLFFLSFPFIANANVLDQEVVFNIDASYDLQRRREMTAILVKITDRLYFFVDKNWWQELDWTRRQNFNNSFHNLSLEFERNIYPRLTAVFGSEPRPGIDRDERITILIHPMIEEVGGYFNSGDVYSKLQNPRSNQREMIYFNSEHIDTPQARIILAHEFIHLITVNQKNLLRNVNEETWLNDVRAEYASTLLGYDDIFRGSNLENRTRIFLRNPNDSLTEWLERIPDYGVVNLFAQYLVDHYGVKILVDSLQSNRVGIESINYALRKNNYNKNFSDIFNNWLIALLVNDCQLGERYCYLNQNLKNFRIAPIFYYLPRTKAVFSTSHNTTYWTGNWHRMVGGGNVLTLEFDGINIAEFKVPYLLCDLNNKCSVDFLSLDEEQRGKITINEFNTKYSSLTLMPFIYDKTLEFNGRESVFSFSWRAVIEEKTEAEMENELRIQLLARINELQQQIRQLQIQIAALRGQQPITCNRFNNNLYFGMRNSLEVRCLQEFLRNQGPDIYPQGLITGNFLNLTQQAVIRFQEKHASEILTPLRLLRGTGFIGTTTRAKINQLLGF